MTARNDRNDYPPWVQMSLWGTSTRRGMWLMTAACVTAAVVFLWLGIVDDPVWISATAMELGLAVWSWLGIRWVDRHGSWSEARVQPVADVIR